MPKILEHEFHSKEKFQITEEQKERFKTEYADCGTLDQFLVAKRALILNEKGYASVLRMPLQSYLDMYAPEYAFNHIPFTHDVPITFWRNVYEQIIEDSIL